MNWFYHIVRDALLRWGYFAVIVALLGENAGLPLPGETVLMFASFLAHKTPNLQLGWVITAGIGAAVTGDNIGFFVGTWAGSPFLRWLEKTFGLKDDVITAREQIRLHGGATVFWARYIVGLRTVTGPVAGAFGMEWKRFLFYNVLGAASWVTAISLCGYLFAKEFQSLLSFFEKASWVIGVGLFVLGYIYWRRRKERVLQRMQNKDIDD